GSENKVTITDAILSFLVELILCFSVALTFGGL
ncbi:unnamed protein product, partial [marine sediment metagenome]